MLAFALPGQPPGPASKLLVNASFGRGSSSRSSTSTSTRCSRGSCSSRSFTATKRSRVVACRLGGAAAASSPTSFPAQQLHHEHSNPLQKPPRPSRRRPRPLGALDASARDNAPDAPRVFDASRGCESEAARDRIELVLRLKDMGRRFEWRGAVKVFRRARARGMVMDNSVYSCIISVVAKSGRWSEAEELLQEAKEDPADLDPNKYCYTAAVSACARGRNWELALSLLDEMREAGLSPDHFTYGSAVSAMARTGQWRRALGLLRRMAGEGLRPNVVCYGAAVDACAKGGQWERAVGLLQEMRDAGVEPDRICYNAAINACAQSGEWETALSLADEMRRSVPVLGTGAGPDVFTFNSIMHGMASAGECERLLVLLAEMRQEYGVSPDVVSYNTAMAACNEVSSRRMMRSVSS
ncbi:unnamed protein product, partial [Ectocarpus sp. 12 AP-2014]